MALYRGVSVEGVTIWRSGQKQGVTPTIRKAIRRRSAIEPAIGHMKNDGKLQRNWLKGSLGDALNAVLCGVGHNFADDSQSHPALLRLDVADRCGQLQSPTIIESDIRSFQDLLNELFRTDYIALLPLCKIGVLNSAEARSG